MIYLPSSRRNLLAALSVLIIILIWRSRSGLTQAVPSLIYHQPAPPAVGIRIEVSHHVQQTSNKYNESRGDSFTHQATRASELAQSIQYAENERASELKNSTSAWVQPVLNPNLELLWRCQYAANQYTGHVRLPAIIQNISQIPPEAINKDERVFWNPTVIPLPYWSDSQYLVVSRIVTDGNYQQNVLCEATFCYVGPEESARKGERPCTAEDLLYTGPAGGLRCETQPLSLSVPPTPAKFCDGKFATYVDIPGFHDPRVFYTGRGEPMMIVNTQSRYACFGLWLIDLRSVYAPLKYLLSSSPRRLSLGPLLSYTHLTELTRNPPIARGPIEKNWFLFYPRSGSSFIHYDISAPQHPERGRTFAQLLGGGFTTPNLTDPHEASCIQELGESEPDVAKRDGRWHQATNSLRLVICSRSDPTCTPGDHNTVFFAMIHRKHANHLKLPLRYERYVAVWSAVPPFSMLGLSAHPLLFANETASGWTMWQNWDDDEENRKTVEDHKRLFGANASDPLGGKEYWAYFTYSVSLSWAWRDKVEVEGLNEGYLDDEVVVSVGIDDKGQGVARVKALDLVSCLRACPGRVV